MDKWLVKASINQLRDFLRGRFQGIGPHAADSGTPVAELPPDLPLELWEQAGDALRSRIIHAIKGLLEEIPADGWNPRAVEWLCFFIASGDVKGARLTDALSSIARRGLWLKRAGDGPRCQATLLRALLDLNWVAEPEFWVHQPAAITKRYPGLVFRGLLAHNADTAFAYLRNAVKDAKHARQIVDVLGDVMDDATQRSQMIEQLRCALRVLPQPVSAYFIKWFRIYGWGDLEQDAPEPRPRPVPCSQESAFGGHVGWRREELLPAAAG